MYLQIASNRHVTVSLCFVWSPPLRRSLAALCCRIAPLRLLDKSSARLHDNWGGYSYLPLHFAENFLDRIYLVSEIWRTNRRCPAGTGCSRKMRLYPPPPHPCLFPSRPHRTSLTWWSYSRRATASTSSARQLAHLAIIFDNAHEWPGDVLIVIE